MDPDFCYAQNQKHKLIHKFINYYNYLPVLLCYGEQLISQLFLTSSYKKLNMLGKILETGFGDLFSVMV